MGKPDPLTHLRHQINPAYRMDETAKVTELLAALTFTEAESTRMKAQATALIEQVRRHPRERTLLEDFMQRYALSTEEGVALMGLAEALLRIPDQTTADALIVDKLAHGQWDHNNAADQKLLTTLSGWGLSVSGHVLQAAEHSVFGKLVKRAGLPVIRPAVMHAVKLLGGQFVAGRTLSEALANGRKSSTTELFSFDMLGEGARTELKAKEYFNQYAHAIETLGQAQQQNKIKNLYARDSISVKLSALHPRYEEAQKDVCLPILIKRVHALAKLARQHDIMLTLDAEEADRLELSLDIFAAVFTQPDLAGFNGFGLAVQAYQKRCHAVLDWLIALARQEKKIIPVRLVKGAYWDSEIKRAQERGLSGYPVYTRKATTDIAYLVAADKMLQAPDAVYAQLATHNALTISSVLTLAVRHGNTCFEFQRLHGMGQPLYAALHDMQHIAMPCRIYAPVGPYQDLLPYLVRRLLENGANSSFVNRIYDKTMPADDLARDPFARVKAYTSMPHPLIALPADIYSDRQNSVSYDLSDHADQRHLVDALASYKTKTWSAAPYPTAHAKLTTRSVTSPQDPSHITGTVYDATSEMIDPALQQLNLAWPGWLATSLRERATILQTVADSILKHQDELIALCVYEAGKTIADSVAEIREAVDFCRYYAARGMQDLQTIILPGPVGEHNELRHEGCGIFVCISPWNFPLAIFIGQIAAALMAGNCVAAKPAPQTTLIAARVVEMMLESGLPPHVIALLPGDGEIGNFLIAHPLVRGVAFTGSTQTARKIQQVLAQKDGPIVPFIAETGGQNAMIADNSALPEQIVDDILRSGIASAGQRCSALRVLYVQDDIAPAIINMLRGALLELRIGDPAELSTDVGPVIDTAAQQKLQDHLNRMPVPLLQATHLPDKGTFIAPTILPLTSIHELTAENFGPVIHLVTFNAAQKDDLIHQINAYGYGLTLGLHSRLQSFIDHVVRHARVGNIYINRGMTGAVVGVQPFGGMGLSGTGPKAGGPHYLQRFAVEKTVTVNLTAVGGNATLANLEQD